MRISDWSSDVCSSDLRGRNSGSRDAAVLRRSVMLSPFHVAGGSLGGAALRLLQVGPVQREDRLDDGIIHIAERSEERRVGKECVSTCRSRWSPYQYKKKHKRVLA